MSIDDIVMCVGVHVKDLFFERGFFFLCRQS